MGQLLATLDRRRRGADGHGKVGLGRRGRRLTINPTLYGPRRRSIGFRPAAARHYAVE
jgi:hypothetical protein